MASSAAPVPEQKPTREPKSRVPCVHVPFLSVLLAKLCILPLCRFQVYTTGAPSCEAFINTSLGERKPAKHFTDSGS